MFTARYELIPYIKQITFRYVSHSSDKYYFVIVSTVYSLEM